MKYTDQQILESHLNLLKVSKAHLEKVYAHTGKKTLPGEVSNLTARIMHLKILLKEMKT